MLRPHIVNDHWILLVFSFALVTGAVVRVTCYSAAAVVCASFLRGYCHGPGRKQPSVQDQFFAVSHILFCPLPGIHGFLSEKGETLPDAGDRLHAALRVD